MLRSGGVHWLKDPDSGRYNFDQHLENIPKVEDFAFDRLGGFVPSSQDHVRCPPLFLEHAFSPLHILEVNRGRSEK